MAATRRTPSRSSLACGRSADSIYDLARRNLVERQSLRNALPLFALASLRGSRRADNVLSVLREHGCDAEHRFTSAPSPCPPALLASAAAAVQEHASAQGASAVCPPGLRSVVCGWLCEASGALHDACDAYARAAQTGCVDGAVEVVRLRGSGCFLFGGGDVDDVAVAVLRDAAACGDVVAQVAYGAWLMEGGAGIRPSAGSAAMVLVEASVAGSAEAQFLLGGLFEEGRGVAKNLSRATELFEKAAAGGHGKALQRVADMRRGDGGAGGEEDEGSECGNEKGSAVGAERQLSRELGVRENVRTGKVALQQTLAAAKGEDVEEKREDVWGAKLETDTKMDRVLTGPFGEDATEDSTHGVDTRSPTCASRVEMPVEQPRDGTVHCQDFIGPVARLGGGPGVEVQNVGEAECDRSTERIEVGSRDKVERCARASAKQEEYSTPPVSAAKLEFIPGRSCKSEGLRAVAMKQDLSESVTERAEQNCDFRDEVRVSIDEQETKVSACFESNYAEGLAVVRRRGNACSASAHMGMVELHGRDAEVIDRPFKRTEGATEAAGQAREQSLVMDTAEYADVLSRLPSAEDWTVPANIETRAGKCQSVANIVGNRESGGGFSDRYVAQGEKKAAACGITRTADPDASHTHSENIDVATDTADDKVGRKEVEGHGSTGLLMADAEIDVANVDKDSVFRQDEEGESNACGALAGQGCPGRLDDIDGTQGQPDAGKIAKQGCVVDDSTEKQDNAVERNEGQSDTAPRSPATGSGETIGSPRDGGDDIKHRLSVDCTAFPGSAEEGDGAWNVKERSDTGVAEHQSLPFDNAARSGTEETRGAGNMQEPANVRDDSVEQTSFACSREMSMDFGSALLKKTEEEPSKWMSHEGNPASFGTAWEGVGEFVMEDERESMKVAREDGTDLSALNADRGGTASETGGNVAPGVSSIADNDWVTSVVGKFVEELSKKVAVIHTKPFDVMGEPVVEDGAAFFWGRGVQQSLKQAVDTWAKQAKTGHPDAMWRLAMCYHMGYGVAGRDAQLAYEWADKSAACGHAIGLYCLGTIFEKGHGVARRADRASELFARAVSLLQDGAACGDAEAMEVLGQCYLYGCGVKADARRGWELFCDAAAAGDANGMHQAGFCYYFGEGVEMDDRVAVELWQRAADAGHVEALENLALCAEHGYGVAQDLAEAENLRCLRRKRLES